MGSEGLSASAIQRLAKELKEIQHNPCDGIKLILNEDSLADVQAELVGPDGTPYEGGVFRMRLVLGHDFPHSPPKGFFITKIFHPNISKQGEICVNVLKKAWTPETGIRFVLMVIRCLLIQPFPDSALNEEAGKLLLENYDDFAKHCRLMTSIHAAPAKRPIPLTASGGANAVNSTNSDATPVDSSLPAVKKPKQTMVKKSVRRL